MVEEWPHERDVPLGFRLDKHPRQPDDWDAFALGERPAFHLIHEQQVGVELFGEHNGLGFSRIQIVEQLSHLNGIDGGLDLNPVGNHWFDYARTGGYLRHCLHRLEQFQSDYDEIVGGEFPTTRGHEYGSYIIEAMETNKPVKVAGNVPNTGLITNLPTGCCVEVPTLVDKNGLQPTKIGKIPPQLAAMMQTNINVQSLAVEAALTRKREYVYHAAMMDPHTAAELSLDQIWHLVDDLIEAHGDYLPPFVG